MAEQKSFDRIETRHTSSAAGTTTLWSYDLTLIPGSPTITQAFARTVAIDTSKLVDNGRHIIQSLAAINNGGTYAPVGFSGTVQTIVDFTDANLSAFTFTIIVSGGKILGRVTQPALNTDTVEYWSYVDFTTFGL